MSLISLLVVMLKSDGFKPFLKQKKKKNPPIPMLWQTYDNQFNLKFIIYICKKLFVCVCACNCGLERVTEPPRWPHVQSTPSESFPVAPVASS